MHYDMLNVRKKIHTSNQIKIKLFISHVPVTHNIIV